MKRKVTYKGNLTVKFDQSKSNKHAEKLKENYSVFRLTVKLPTLFYGYNMIRTTYYFQKQVILSNIISMLEAGVCSRKITCFTENTIA